MNHFTLFTGLKPVLTRLFVGLLCMASASLSLPNFAWALGDWDPSSSSRFGNPQRTYPGGLDEEDLQVQPELVEPRIKLTEQMLQNQILNDKGRSSSRREPPTSADQE